MQEETKTACQEQTGMQEAAAGLPSGLQKAAGLPSGLQKAAGLPWKYILCLLCFLLCGFLSWHILEMHRVQKENIPVWLVLPDGMTEETAVTLWGSVTAGFETVCSGYGIDLVLYTDAETYSKALAACTPEHAPVVCMNIPEDTQGNAEPVPKADLSALTEQLGEQYMTDLTTFHEEIPLSWSIPVLLTADTSIAGDTVDRATLPASVREYALHDGNHPDTVAVLLDLVEHPESSVLSDSAALSVLQQNPAISGAVGMYYICTEGVPEIQYHTYCFVNAAASARQQQVAMCWMGYVLSQEAQERVFTQQGGYFPMHAQAFTDMTRQHQAFSVLPELLDMVTE